MNKYLWIVSHYIKHVLPATNDLNENEGKSPPTHSDDGEYLWHEVPSMLLDNGDDLTELFE